MKKTPLLLTSSLITILISIVISLPKVYAATSPNLGLASSFGILSSTYTNTAIGTTITGDLGYTTGPAVAPTVSGTTYSPPSGTYTTAGTDQANALADLNAQSCDFSFGAATNLSSLTQPLAPGVYCITGAMSIVSGITLQSGGTYIFRSTGALNTTAGTTVALGGASACDVFWTPTGATTLGANSTFAGTDIDAAGITIGSTVSWTGRALAFGGTVSTDADTITVPTCITPTPTPSPTPTPTLIVTAVPTPIPPTPTSAASIASNLPISSTFLLSNNSIASCPILTSVAPTIIESRRISPTNVFISWGPYSGNDQFIVLYGPENENWLYSTNVTGFSTTLNDLSANQPIWVRVGARNDCSIGSYGEGELIGEPSLPNTGKG